MHYRIQVYLPVTSTQGWWSIGYLARTKRDAIKRYQSLCKTWSLVRIKKFTAPSRSIVVQSKRVRL